jgi:hypothetical protein
MKRCRFTLGLNNVVKTTPFYASRVAIIIFTWLLADFRCNLICPMPTKKFFFKKKTHHRLS